MLQTISAEGRGVSSENQLNNDPDAVGKIINKYAGLVNSLMGFSIPVGLAGIEPATQSLKGSCSTTELQA